MTELTPEQQRVLDTATDQPPVVVDRRTDATYVLVRAEVYEQLTRKENQPSEPADREVPEGIRSAKAALRRDLPRLLADRRTRGKYVCYHKGERVAVGKDYVSVMGEVVRRDIPEEEYIVARVRPGAGSDEEEEVDRTFVELDQDSA
ncbi:MAG: hypothetical protein JWO38_8130 [Gemmataceae bacterium]|nr:hypothetical protein [Gemmataceae bacterium]